jgi:hypothetical protein
MSRQRVKARTTPAPELEPGVNPCMQQVEEVCRGLAPGEMPDLPPFLRREPSADGSASS